MELRQLKYFVEVARLGSFSMASKALFITQSTISQQIAKNLYYQTIHRTTAVKAAEIFIMIELEEKYSKEDLAIRYKGVER